MTTASRELAEILDSLPEEQAREVVDFARFLQQKAGDHEWERILADPKPLPKLDAFVNEALREEPGEPLDPSQL